MVRKLAVSALILLAAGGCTRTGEITEGGIAALRSACPRVGVPAGTGDITTFNPPASREAKAIDVVAAMTNVTSVCDDAGDDIVTTVSFHVLATRPNGGPARDVSLPYFLTVVQGNSAVVAKSVGRVTVRFEDGQTRASTSGTATSSVARSAATLSAEVRKRLTEKRKAGDQSAALDPLADPAIRQAVLTATFEALVGFQLTEEQLRYNMTR